jgi:acetyl-CoA carboxylase biotin carboxyl carrier protein
MEIKEIRQLIKLVENADISEIEIIEEGKKIRISKNSKNSSESYIMNPPPMVSYQPGVPMSTPAVPVPTGTEIPMSESTGISTEETSDNYHEVRSPMVGTFYRSPAPDADAYVEVGQMVDVGSPLCIIEAMKLMNEFESEYAGKISKILIENAQPVEYNQVLFLIEK